MGEVRLSAAQARVVAAWSEEGADFLPLVVHTSRPGYARDWRVGDVLVTQGDAYVHVGSTGSSGTSSRRAS
jgi:hypothetical protein